MNQPGQCTGISNNATKNAMNGAKVSTFLTTARALSLAPCPYNAATNMPGVENQDRVGKRAMTAAGSRMARAWLTRRARLVRPRTPEYVVAPSIILPTQRTRPKFADGGQ